MRVFDIISGQMFQLNAVCKSQTDIFMAANIDISMAANIDISMVANFDILEYNLSNDTRFQLK